MFLCANDFQFDRTNRTKKGKCKIGKAAYALCRKLTSDLAKQ